MGPRGCPTSPALGAGTAGQLWRAGTRSSGRAIANGSSPRPSEPGHLAGLATKARSRASATRDGRGPAQQIRIVLEIAQAGVALVAEQEAQHARVMTVIDAELGVRPPLADRAETVLRSHHPIIVRLGQAVLAPETQLGCRPRPLL